ncbi:hypothetical protein ACJX0J_028784, partial [Zea mays]
HNTNYLFITLKDGMYAFPFMWQEVASIICNLQSEIWAYIAPEKNRDTMKTGGFTTHIA